MYMCLWIQNQTKISRQEKMKNYQWRKEKDETPLCMNKQKKKLEKNWAENKKRALVHC